MHNRKQRTSAHVIQILTDREHNQGQNTRQTSLPLVISLWLLTSDVMKAHLGVLASCQTHCITPPWKLYLCFLHIEKQHLSYIHQVAKRNQFPNS